MPTSPTTIEVQVDRTDEAGNTTTETVALDLDLNTLSLRESVALEEALGSSAFDALMQKGEFAMRPSVIQAVLYAKLKGRYSEVGINDFDFDLSAVADIGKVKEQLAMKVKENGGSPNAP